MQVQIPKLLKIKGMISTKSSFLIGFFGVKNPQKAGCPRLESPGYP
jgi:hypothetical protein